ncbi:hypothetical protein H5410_028029 [Solanum commersonii]|uniref:Uncharacterized protein n=1 Tax=Solanum commersonii TaxID=4109 RepID=A0A9J5Z0W6_SOLCO|nr:hypothetical protein H5410_028029 [Solanum commersonii]
MNLDSCDINGSRINGGQCQSTGRDLTFSLLYDYAYKSTANPFEQDSCKLGSVVLEGDSNVAAK